MSRIREILQKVYSGKISVLDAESRIETMLSDSRGNKRFYCKYYVAPRGAVEKTVYFDTDARDASEVLRKITQGIEESPIVNGRVEIVVSTESLKVGD